MTFDLASKIFQTVETTTLIYFTVLNSVYLLTSLAAFVSLRKYLWRLRSLNLDELLSAGGAPPVTLILPSHNEETSVVDSVRSLLTLQYQRYEIIVVNDGSTDRTLERLTEAYDLVPASRMPTATLPTAPIRGIYQARRRQNIYVVDKEQGGKADALNAGINLCHTPLFCAMDADSVLEREALLRLVRPFLEDATMIAAGGIIRIVNGCKVVDGEVKDVRLPKGWIPKFQVLEYLRAFLCGRMGWGALGATMVISGAFGLFKRSVIVDAGGYARDTVGEDMELIIRLHRHCCDHKIPYRMEFVADPVAWTECPTTIKGFMRQRDRWQRGLIDCLSRHRAMLFRPKYGIIGMVAFPYFYIFEMFGPAIELSGYIVFGTSYALNMISYRYGIAFLTLAYLFGVALSVASVGLEEMCFRRYPRYQDMLWLFFLCFTEIFGYRQLSTYFRLQGNFTSLRRIQTWGKAERKGFAAASS